MWTLNPLPRNLKHPQHSGQTFFMNKSSKTSTTTTAAASSSTVVEGFKSSMLLSCLFHLKPFDMLFPGLSLSSFENTTRYLSNQGGAKSSTTTTTSRTTAATERAMQQFETSKIQSMTNKVISVSFHPSMTFVGRNPSILVGLASGDIIKFNIDHKIMDLDARITFLKPFVKTELLHPIESSGSGQLVAAGLRDDQIMGNKVHRELLHFHKSQVIFLDIVHRISNKIVSVDSSGVVALWEYDEKAASLRNAGWFSPSQVAYLDLGVVEYVLDTEISPKIRINEADFPPWSIPNDEVNAADQTAEGI